MLSDQKHEKQSTLVLPEKEIHLEDFEPITPGEQFLEDVFPVTEGYAQNLRVVRNARVKTVDEEALTLTLMCANDDVNDYNRRSQRQIKQNLRDIRRQMHTLIGFAQSAAQGTIYESDDEEKQQDIQKLETEIKEVAVNPRFNDIKKYYAHAWLEIFAAERERYTSEAELREQLGDYIKASPANLLSLIDALEDPELDLDAHRPLLQLITKNIHDPGEEYFGIDYVNQGFSYLREHLEEFIEGFAHTIETELTEEPDETCVLTPENREWLDLVVSLTGRKVYDLLIELPLDEWPAPLRQQLTDSSTSFIEDAVNRLKTIVEPYLQSTKAHFFVPGNVLHEAINANITQGNTGKKKTTKKRSSGGRTTTKRNLSPYVSNVEKEQELPISRVGTLKQINGGAQAADMHEVIESNAEDAAGELLQTKPFQKYLSHYNGDQALADDLSRMVSSIIAEPQGNGVSKMSAVRLPYQLDDGRHKKLTVWHLNPNRRTGLTLSDTGRETRIFYVLAPAENTDVKQLLVLSVLHKNDAAKIRSSIPTI